MEQNNLISINDLVKRFPVGKGEFTALNGINLTINTGEFAGLVGPSGSGKTTLLNIIGSLDNPTEGDAKHIIGSCRRWDAGRGDDLLDRCPG